MESSHTILRTIGDKSVNSIIWVFTALADVQMAGKQEVQLNDRIALQTPNDLLLSCRDQHALGGEDFRRMETVSCFLLLREAAPPLRTPERQKYSWSLQNALMAFQILKPLYTYGCIFQAIQPSRTL